MTTATTIAAAVLECGIAALLLRRARVAHGDFPWLAPLAALFVVRAATRFAEAGGLRAGGAAAAADLVTIVLVLVVALTVLRNLGGVSSAVRDAESRRVEYERALLDYRTLVRHRLATPLTAIRGSAITLRDLPSLTADQMHELVQAIEEAASHLEQVALDPNTRAPEEHGLEPRPHLARAT